MRSEDARALAWGIVGTLVATGISYVIGLVAGDFVANFNLVPQAWRLVGLLLIMGVSVANLRGREFKLDTGLLAALSPAILGLATFVVLLGWGPDTETAAYGSLLGSMLVVIASQSTTAGLEARRLRHAVKEATDLGFATTGVLIDLSDPEDPRFLLVFNQNLRAGEGLFVPPGGHFTPATERPVPRLLDKIRSEIGVQATVETDAGMLPPAPYMATEGAEWIEAPAFVLREDMYGRCSHGHSEHHDYVYICVTDGVRVAGIDPRYPPEARIEISLGDCAPSFEGAQRAVHNKADQWYRRSRGRPTSLRTYVTDDVIWRLHLAARRHGGLET